MLFLIDFSPITVWSTNRWRSRLSRRPQPTWRPITWMVSVDIRWWTWDTD